MTESYALSEFLNEPNGRLQREHVCTLNHVQYVLNIKFQITKQITADCMKRVNGASDVWLLTPSGSKHYQ